jgi:hypothetical protein
MRFPGRCFKLGFYLQLKRAIKTATLLPFSQRSPTGPRPHRFLLLTTLLAWTGITPVFALEPSSAPEKNSTQLLFEHTIEAGDTLSTLAERYGSSVEAMVQANAVTNVRKLQIGARLRVPFTRSVTASSLPATPIASSDKKHRIEIERLTLRSEKQLRDARFEAALDSVHAARALLSETPDSFQRNSRVRLEIVSATIHVALGDNAAAQLSMQRALQADSGLTLDPAVVSPKVLRILRIARQHAP